MATSDDDVSELIDEDALPAEFPPDRPLGANQYGTTPQEERVDEPLAERVLREEPEERPVDAGVQLIDQTEDGFGAGVGSDIDVGETGDEMLGEIGGADNVGGDDGPSLGMPSSDTAADRVPMSAEEAAVHVVDLEGDAGGVEY